MERLASQLPHVFAAFLGAHCSNMSLGLTVQI